MKLINRFPARHALAGSLLAALGTMAGCANVTSMAPGSTIAQVREKFGAPTLSCNLANGGTRAIWSQQPLGQYAYGTNVSADGRIDRVVPVLTDAHFERLSQNTWSAEQVRCEFGPPAEIKVVGLGNMRETVWSYRYRQQNSFNSLMYVYLGPNGTQVTHFHPGPDPMFDTPGNGRS